MVGSMGSTDRFVVRKTPRSCILERYTMTYRSEGIVDCGN